MSTARERELTRERVRRHRERKAEEAETSAAQRATEAERERQYQQLIQRFGEDRAANWKLTDMCGVCAYRLLELDSVTDENASEYQDLIDFVGYLDGERYHEDPELPRTRWHDYLKFADEAARLGFEMRPRPKRVREFFLDWYNSARWRSGLPILIAGETLPNDFRREWKPAPEELQKEPMLISAAAKSFREPLYRSELVKGMKEKPQEPTQPTVAQILAPEPEPVPKPVVPSPPPPPPQSLDGFCIGSLCVKRGGAGTIFKITGFQGDTHALVEFRDEDNNETVEGLRVPLSSLALVKQ